MVQLGRRDMRKLLSVIGKKIPLLFLGAVHDAIDKKLT